ncbi:MAG: hypothetical protein ABIE94_03400 [archaeon]
MNANHVDFPIGKRVNFKIANGREYPLAEDKTVLWLWWNDQFKHPQMEFVDKVESLEPGVIFKFPIRQNDFELYSHIKSKNAAVHMHSDEWRLMMVGDRDLAHNLLQIKYPEKPGKWNDSCARHETGTRWAFSKKLYDPNFEECLLNIVHKLRREKHVYGEPIDTLTETVSGTAHIYLATINNNTQIILAGGDLDIVGPAKVVEGICKHMTKECGITPVIVGGLHGKYRLKD